MVRIGIIGYGNIGRVLASHLTRNHDTRCVVRGDMDITTGSRIRCTKDWISIVQRSKVLVLAIKPHDLSELAEKMSNIKINDEQNQILVSAMARTPISLLREHFPTHQIVRIMPNIYANRGSSIPAFIPDDPCMTDTSKIVRSMFPKTLYMVPNEEYLDDSTIYNGCAPAFVAWVYSQMILSTPHFKHPDNDNESSLNQHLAEAACIKAMEETIDDIRRGVDPKDIIKRVASPGGVTESILNRLDQVKFTDEQQ